MRLRYFADDGPYDVEAPEGSRIAFRSHVQVGVDTFLDDLLLVPWQDRVAPIPGEIVPVLARSGMYGLRLVGWPRCRGAAVSSPAASTSASAHRPARRGHPRDPNN